MKIYMIAGESSGDLIGGLLLNALKQSKDKKFDKVKICGIGGPQMISAGLKSLFPFDQINLMGFVEIIPHIFRIKKLIDQTLEDIINQDPQIVITIDSPGFTYRIAKRLKKKAPHIKLLHIVAPSVWAYRPNRAKKYAKLYDHLLTLLPFEPQYFSKHGLPSTHIGHPILEQNFYQYSQNLRKKMNIDEETKTITVTAGSRKGEIARHMPIIRKVFDRLAMTHKIKVIFVQTNQENIKLISKFLDGARFPYVFSTDRLKAFAASDCALAKSGTNTLEIAASGTAMIVGYKLNPITFSLLKACIKVKYASLINILSNREIIPEYIQSDFNVDNLVLALDHLLKNHEIAKEQVTKAQKSMQLIGLNGNKKPSIAALEVISNILNE